MSVGVVIPVKDHLDLTRHIVDQCLDDPGVAEVVVLDNGSTDGTAEWLDSRDGVVRLDMPTANIHEMWNTGIEYMLSPAGPDDLSSVAILNNDLDLGFMALSECDTALRNIPSLAAVCPNYDGRTATKARTVVPTSEICAGRYDGTGGLAGFAMVIAVDWLIGGYRFPEECRWWFGDNDLVLTIGESRRRCGIVIDATVVHLDGGGQTGDWMSPEKMDAIRADAEWFRSKWGQQ